MKKVFLMLTVLGLVTLTSCKKDEAKVEDSIENATNQIEESAENAADVVENTTAAVSNVPQFSNSDVQTYANELAKYYEELAAAAKEGNQEKLSELMKQQVDFAQKQQALTQKMTAEDAQKFQAWAAEIQKAAQL